MAGQTILVIDDDESLSDLISMAIKLGGYKPAAAGDGIQAMLMVRQLKPSLIILDYMFPAGGGGAMHKRLRLLADTKSTPIILLSAVPEDIIAQNVDMDGNTYYLAKPYRRDHLLALIGQIIS